MEDNRFFEKEIFEKAEKRLEQRKKVLLQNNLQKIYVILQMV